MFSKTKRFMCTILIVVIMSTIIPFQVFAAPNVGTTVGTLGTSGSSTDSCYRCVGKNGVVYYETTNENRTDKTAQNQQYSIASESQKFASPTNLHWETEHKQQYECQPFSYVHPGFISWTAVAGCSDYLITIYDAAGKSVDYNYWRLPNSVANSEISVDDFLLNIHASGTYKFSVQATSDNCSDYNSDTVYSGSWTYVKPSSTLSVPTGFSANGKVLSWNPVSNAGGYYLSWTYSDKTSGNTIGEGGCWRRNNDSDWDLSNFISAAGIYHFRVRSLSNDITKICNSGLSETFSVYYDGTAFGSNNTSNISVHSTNNDEVLEQSKLDLNELLDNVSFGTDKIYGPSITILGKTFNLFELSGKVNLDLGSSKWNLQAKADTKEKTVQVLVGFDAISESSTTGSEQSERGDWQKSWHEVKDLYKALSGSEAGGWMAGPGYRNLYNKLVDKDSTLFLNIKGKIAGYLEWSYETGKMEFSEGGIILTASAGGSIDSRIPAFPAAYVTVGLEVKATGKVSVACNGTQTPVSINSDVTLSPAINVGVGLGSKKAKTYVEGGLKGTLDVGIHATTGSFDNGSYDPLTVAISGSVYVKAKIILLSGSAEYQLCKKQLYPKSDGATLSGIDDSDNLFSVESYDDFKLLPRDYLNSNNGPSLMGSNDSSLQSLGSSFSYSKDNLYPYCEPQLIVFSDGSALLLWVDDNGQKGSADRTSLFYSTYDPATDSWSENNTIWDNHGYNGSPEIYYDGVNVHILWQRINQSFGESATVDQMMQAVDLYYTSFSDGSFSEPVCISNSTRQYGEMMYSIAAENGIVAVCWVENSQNDALMTTGSNVLYMRTCVNGVWQNEQKIAESDNSINSTCVRIINGNAYTIYELGSGNTDNETLSSLLVWDGENSTVICSDATGAFNPLFSSGTLYYLYNTSLYSYDVLTQTAAETGLTDLTNFDIVSNGSDKAVLSLVSTGFTCEMYASFLNQQDSSWGEWTQMTNFGKYIRGYSASMNENGEISAAMNLAEVLEIAGENDEVYGAANLVVVDGIHYADFVVNNCLGYNADDVIAGKDISFIIDAINNSQNTVNKLNVTITDQNGNVLSSQEITKEIGVGESAEIEVTCGLPADLSKQTLTATVIPDYEESNTTNNIASATIGYADIAVTDATLHSYPTGAIISATVKNSGYSTASDIIVTVRDANASGKVLATLSCDDLESGSEENIQYKLDDNYLFLDNDNSMYALYLQAESNSEEIKLSNNDSRVVFENALPISVIANKEQNDLKISVSIKNYSESTLTNTLVAAIYDNNGKMLGTQYKSVVSNSGDANTVEFTFDSSSFANACSAKVFWLNNNNMAPLSISWNKTFTTEQSS